MSRFLADPVTRRFSERPIRRLHRSTKRGMLSDLPEMDIPLDAVKDAENVILHPYRREVRSGTRRISSTQLPTLATGISASKSGSTITISAGYSPTSANVGDYFVWPDDGKNELITAVSGSDLTVTSSSTHANCTTGAIRQEANAACWDSVHDKHVLHIGTKIYYASWNISSWTEAYCVTPEATPANAKSVMAQYGDNVFLWNDNGLYVIEMGATVPTCSRVNNAPLEPTITEVEETSTLIYGRRYNVTMAEMLDSYHTGRWDGNQIMQESAPFQVDSNGQDYSAVFTTKPVGDASDTYAVLTGGTLNALRDEVSDWEAISNGQARFTANSKTFNVVVDFSGVLTWSEVAGRIQSALRDYWPDAKFEYDEDHFVFTMLKNGDTLDYCTAGDAGTDISDSTYLNMQTGQGTKTTPSTTATSEIGYLQAPYTLSGSTYTFINAYTHYGVYGTKDIGDNGIDAVTGKGNDSELFIHVEDVPIISSFVVSTAGDGTVTASKGTFHEYDVGSTLYLDDGKSGAITAFTSSSVVTWDQTDVTTDLGATIGTDKPFVFDQSAYTVTASSGTPFDSDSVGKRIFASDGTLIVITAYTSSTVVTVADSATRSGLGGGILKSPTADGNANRRKFTDRVSDTKLSRRVARHWLRNRFWQPIPDCELGVVANGFLVSAEKDKKTIYQTQLAYDYLIGYYDPDFQVDTTQDAIQRLRVYRNIVAAICSHSTTVWDSEVTETEERPDVGESSSYFSQKRVVDDAIGTRNPDSIVSVHEGTDILLTNESEIRLFNGLDYGPNIVADRMMKRLRKLQGIGTASYDVLGGFRLWGTEGSLTTIGSTDRLPYPDICYRFAITDDQGVTGGIRITGTDWVKPPNGVPGYQIEDSNGKTRQVALDNNDGRFYWISTYDGPSISETFVDKVDGAGGGTEISWSITYGADTGDLRSYDVRHTVSRLTVVPHDATNAGDSGYDTEGFRSGLEIDFEAYVSPDWETAYATADDVTKDGDITYDETPEGAGIQHKISGNRSEVILLELLNYYTVIDSASEPSKREMSEGDYQENLNTPLLWLSRHSNLYKNLATGSNISGTATSATGPDGKSDSAFQISAALDTISVALSSGSVLFWADGTVALTIGGDSVALSSVGTNGGFTLYYATGITKTGTLRLTPSGTRKIADVRAYNSEIDSDTRTYLYNDMIRNDGDNTLPIW